MPVVLPEFQCLHLVKNVGQNKSSSPVYCKLHLNSIFVLHQLASQVDSFQQIRDCVLREAEVHSYLGFVQMLLSTVSAGLIVPLVWAKPLGLAMAMAAYLLFGYLVLRLSQVWRTK